MNDKLKQKLRLALNDGVLTPEQLTKILTFKTRNQLTNLMNALNEMYSNDELIPVMINEQKHLMLVRR